MDIRDSPSVRVCPSAPAKEGALLLGAIGQNGRLQPLRPPLPVDEAFLDRARRHGPPERRFRFASACLEGGCRQWTGATCGIAARVVEAFDAAPPATAEPARPCDVRGSCRWYAEHGAKACGPCAYVVTDARAAADETGGRA